MKEVVPLELSQPAFEALAGGVDASAERSRARLEAAIRCYLGDKGSGRVAWPFPEFLRESESQVDVRLELSVDEDLWASFAAEAEAQGVSVQQLSEHAAFYFVAEIDAGRITQRILDDLAATEDAPEASETDPV